MTYELTDQQVELIREAIGYWSEDQEMLYQDGDHEDPEQWEEYQEILNDNFPF